MSRTPMYDPLTSDARSSWLAGLTEACNKLSGVLDMKVRTFTNLTLPELYIAENDRFRIYQAPLGNKLWLTEPAPVIKKNGTVITPENDGFTIDYLGGSIVFESSNVLTERDVITADASYIVDESNKISSILASIDTIEEEAGKNKGVFDTVADLEGAYPNASAGDFAIVSSENAIYIWDDTAKEWVNVNAKVDLTSYFTKTEINALLDEKQDTILAKEIPSGSSESATDYFYSGNKTWVSLIAKIKGCALSGLVTNDDSQVEAADTLLEAIGKLQAQINSFIHPIVGNSAPTTSTVGIVGQDYINKSNGDKYRLISIEGSGTSKTYIWQKYGATSVTNFTISIPSSAWSNKSCTISNSNIQAGNEYTYFVGPSDYSYKVYNESAIYADNITTNGIITFHASETPTDLILVDICKMSGSTNGGKVYNVGGGGGSNKNAVTVYGGGHMTMEEVFGPPPYEIEFTEENPENFTSSDIDYNNESSGLSATNVQSGIDELNSIKQSKLTGSAGQVVGFGADGAAVAQDGWSNINMAPNWYFPDPVNQRREETYTCVSDTAVKTTKCIDRYRIDAALGTTSTLTLEEDGILFEVSRTDDKGRQGTVIFTLPEYQLTPGTWTFSTLYSANCKIRPYIYSLATSSVVPGWQDFPISDTPALAAYTFNLNEAQVSGRMIFNVQLNSAVDASAKIVALKLEQGSKSTLTKAGAGGNVVLNDPPPNKAVELLKCQRYYQVFSSADIRPTKAVDFRPPMRIDPALSTIEIDGVTYYTADANL